MADQLKVGDHCYLTREAAESEDLKEKMWQGGVINQIEGDVAVVTVTRRYHINLKKLTKPTGDNAFDPIP